jgi:hypothetical protein
MFLHPNFFYRIGKFLADSTTKRRDVWPSREEAHKLFRERSLKSWDPRVIDLYVVRIHSISDVQWFLLQCRDMAYENSQPWPTLTRPEESRSNVQRSRNLCVTVVSLLPIFLDSHPLQATYSENTGHVQSRRFLSTFCKDVPTHVVFGAVPDMMCAFVYL